MDHCCVKKQIMDYLILALMIMKKNDSIKTVLDVRHLNSNTNQSAESGPLKPLAAQVATAH